MLQLTASLNSATALFLIVVSIRRPSSSRAEYHSTALAVGQEVAFFLWACFIRFTDWFALRFTDEFSVTT
jgi:hypothetical protein